MIGKIPDDQREHMLNQLLEVRFHGGREQARQFLIEVFEHTTELAWFVLPIATRLLTFPDWRTISIDALVEYCAKYSPFIDHTIDFEHTTDCDPQVVLMSGLMWNFAVEHGLIVLPEPAPASGEVDYFGIMRGLVG